MSTAVATSQLAPPVAFNSLEDIFAGYAAVAPLAHALYRTAEANHLRQAPLLPPVLDMGCGSGEFARFALRSDIDMGIDLSWQRLDRCRRHSGYQQLCQGDAGRLPFADDHFQTVLAVSVFEHLDQPHQVLAELRRVLQPGGHLAGTATLLDMHEQLFYPWLLRALGLSRLAYLYLRLHDWSFGHRCLLSQSQWEEMLVANGFELVVSRKIVAPRLTQYWDLLLALAWPSRLLPDWAYSWIGRPPGLRALVQKRLLPMCRANDGKGSSLFFVARKAEE